MSRTEPVSPELVLVSPELAARAREALPDRPWEAFAPPGPRHLPRRVVIRAGALPQRLDLGPPARRPVPPRRPFVHVFVGYLALAALVLSALTLAAEQTPTPSLVAGEAPRAYAAGPLPDIAYGFPGGQVRVTGDEGGRVVVVLTEGCAAGAATPSVALVDGAFAFEGALTGVDVHAMVRGRVLNDRHVSLRLALLGPGCDAGPVTAIATVSGPGAPATSARPWAGP